MIVRYLQQLPSSYNKKNEFIEGVVKTLVLPNGYRDFPTLDAALNFIKVKGEAFQQIGYGENLLLFAEKLEKERLEREQKWPA
jgi:hypothetical protein